ncbi:C-type lectin domain family 4 member F-like [Aplysia californica]|uniref:C-type lectin domain family 4 member F-like n=1 Tax=Aplysia californica TaxID=6500 RepID=A0ABM0JJ32_APLCA|nr:C-type lectin domain family 4 member F-like [Aplysia californica]
MDMRDDVPPRPQNGQSIHKYKKLCILKWICVVVTSLLVSSAAVVVIVQTVSAINKVSTDIGGRLSAVQEKFDSLEKKVSDDVNKAQSSDKAYILAAINQVSTIIISRLSAVQKKFDNLEEKVSDDVKARSSDKAGVLTAINQVSTNIGGQLSAVQKKFDSLEEKVSKVEDDVTAQSSDKACVLAAINQVSTNISRRLSAVQEKFDKLEEKVSEVEDDVKARSKLKLCSHGNGCELTSRPEAMTHCYTVFEQKTTWADARKKCESLGGFLAEFHDHASLEYVKRVVTTDTSRLWLGATDLGKEGIWTWVTSNRRLSVEDWARTQPDNYKNNEHCLEIRKEIGRKVWNDMPCDYKLGYLCQRDGDKCEGWL